MNESLLAGVARFDITPPTGIAHANWGAAVHERAEGVDMPLAGTALVVSSGLSDVAIVSVDLLDVSKELVGAIRSEVTRLAKIPGAQVCISATHTHSGPTMTSDTWVSEGKEMIHAYVASLPHRDRKSVV